MEIVRVTLKEFDESFITKEYVSWLNDPELMKYSEQRHLTHTIESCKAYFESFKGTDNLLYAILEPNDIDIQVTLAHTSTDTIGLLMLEYWLVKLVEVMVFQHGKK